MQQIQIGLETKTPLWTGGTDGTMDELHETGIMGSLRWWYEVIVRGVGGKACDPVANPCSLENEKFKNSSANTLEEKLHEAGLCSACQIFGATGWKRRFRLVMTGSVNEAGPGSKNQTTGNRYKKNSQEHPAWYFKGKGRAGNIHLTLTSLNPAFDPTHLLGPLFLAAEYGGVAAKNQMGYGWVVVDHAPPFSPLDFINSIYLSTNYSSPDLPSFDKMFFAELETNDRDIKATLNLKYDIRNTFRTTFTSETLRHFICGTVHGERMASKIFMTQEVDGKMRVWGWIPEQLPVPTISRESILSALHSTIGKYGAISKWREFSSQRDTLAPGQSDTKAFFVSLF